jgi:hypothetical protein
MAFRFRSRARGPVSVTALLLGLVLVAASSWTTEAVSIDDFGAVEGVLTLEAARANTAALEVRHVTMPNVP